MAKFCSNCGNKVEEGQAVCLHCGFSLKDNASADPSIKVLFDIENKQPVEASDEELMDMYVECFKGVSRKRVR